MRRSVARTGVLGRSWGVVGRSMAALCVVWGLLGTGWVVRGALGVGWVVR